MPELDKTYAPAEVEARWYQRWLNEKCFQADPGRVSEKRPAYSIVIPPPNVTGILTLGHVLNNTIQDILARRARMLGKEVLWLPGTDHAGIATQNAVEKVLRKEGVIKHRDDLGREKLVEKIWEWKDKYGGIILQQLRAIGASCDWSRTRFTLDDDYSRCVQQVFVDLYQKGLIYRGKRMVNWCPSALSAISDEEVVMKQQKGLMYHFRVEVVLDGNAATEEDKVWLTIATTRPETIPGDTAVAVNPRDPRYAHLIGKHVRRPLPLENQALIPIIADEHVDFEFGTGVLKVTPAHDRADFEIGQRHALPVIDILHPNAILNGLAGKDLEGLDRFEGRKKAVELLREQGALVAEEPHQNNVGYSERADVPIEPRLSEQWFLKYPSVDAAQEVVAKQKMRFFPDRWAKVYDHWMGGLQDWCISRQLWWGHRVPVWYKGEEIHCGMEAPAGEGWQQDPDVLDTWFSSWLWPFATMGWPAKAAELQAFYPTTDLVTGPDIIFFWVARMIMAGYEYMGEMPFKNVYFTGIIRDKQGRKMSKSLGNSPDPLELVAKYSADALRFGVMRSAPLGQDILFDEKNVELGRNFCTKLWNAARFRQMQAHAETIEAEINPTLLTLDDKWILLRLNATISEVTAALEEYRFSDATNALYRFFWTEYCDWYVESCKATLQSGDSVRKANTLAVIDFLFSHTLRMFHPFIPFITEELWQGMGFNADMPEGQGGKTIMSAPWPKPLDEDELSYFGILPEDETAAQSRYDVVNLGRGLKSTFNIASNKRTRFVLKTSTALAEHDREVLRILLNAEPLDVLDSYTATKGTPLALTPLGELFLPLEGLIDVAAERERLSKELTKVETELAKVRAKLADTNFTSKVPPKVLDEHTQREADWAQQYAKIKSMADALAG
jgi:valyl-tRNA synthetase